MDRTKLHIPEPCDANWAEMDGDERARFCDHCSKHVHHLSEMTRHEAVRLLDEHSVAAKGMHSLCVRYSHSREGEVRFRAVEVEPSAPPRQVKGAWQLQAAALLLWTTACSPLQAFEEPMVMGGLPPMEGEDEQEPCDGEEKAEGETDDEWVEMMGEPEGHVQDEAPMPPPLAGAPMWQGEVEFLPAPEPRERTDGGDDAPCEGSGDAETAAGPSEPMRPPMGRVAPPTTQRPKAAFDPVRQVRLEIQAAEKLAAYGIVLQDVEFVSPPAEPKPAQK